MEPPQKKQKKAATVGDWKTFSMNISIGGGSGSRSTENKSESVAAVPAEPSLERHNFCKDVWYYDDEGKGKPFAHSPVDSTSVERLNEHTTDTSKHYLYRHAAIRIHLQSGKTMWCGNWQTLGGAVWSHLWPNGSRLYATHGPKPKNPEDDDAIVGALLIYNIDPAGGNTPYYPVDRKSPPPSMDEDINGGRYRYRYFTMREMRVVSRNYYWDARLEGQKNAHKVRQEEWAEHQAERQKIRDDLTEAKVKLPLAIMKQRESQLLLTELEAKRSRFEIKLTHSKTLLRQETDQTQKAVLKEQYLAIRAEFQPVNKAYWDARSAVIQADYEKSSAESSLRWAQMYFNDRFPKEARA